MSPTASNLHNLTFSSFNLSVFTEKDGTSTDNEDRKEF